jgi:hypothetical protein
MDCDDCPKSVGGFVDEVHGFVRVEIGVAPGGIHIVQEDPV